jgi:hypothetical protein
MFWVMFITFVIYFKSASSFMSPSSSFTVVIVVFQQTHQLVLGNTSHYPVNNSLMIGDYVTPGSAMLGAQTYRQ